MGRMSRRDFLRVVGQGSAAAATAAYAPCFYVDNAYAQTAPGLKVLNIFLSGGCDWFLTHERTGNTNFMSTFTQIRPTLSVPIAARRALAGSEYTVHNRLTEYETGYAAGDLAVVMSVGVPLFNSGSHEEATNHFARAVNNGRSSERSGWMQRVAKQYFTDRFQLLDLAGGSNFTRTGDFGSAQDFRGVAVTDLAGFGFNANARGESSFRLAAAFASIAQSGGNAEQLAVQKGWNEVETSVSSVAAAVANTTLNPAFPNTGIGRQLRDAFRAFANFPTRLAYTTTGGYDLHSAADPTGQAVNTPQGQSRLLRDLNDAISAFRQNCQRIGIWNDMAILVNSEFGRTNRENGNRGVDHGDASVCFVLGGAVNGGHYGAAPESSDLLRPQNGVDAKVAITDVAADLVARMGYDPAVIFPGFTRTPLGIV